MDFACIALVGLIGLIIEKLINPYVLLVEKRRVNVFSFVIVTTSCSHKVEKVMELNRSGGFSQNQNFEELFSSKSLIN